MAIYGWHQTNGVPTIQPLYLGHTASWVDYSQCIRLVSNEIILNGKSAALSDVLADPKFSVLLSDEGPISNPRYPTNQLASLSRTTNSVPALPIITFKPGPFHEAHRNVYHRSRNQSPGERTRSRGVHQ